MVAGDATGVVTLRLSSEEMKELSVGDVVEIRNGAVKMTKASEKHHFKIL